MTNCKVLVANTPMDTDKVKIYGSKIKVDSVAKVAEIEAAEKKKMLDKVRTFGWQATQAHALSNVSQLSMLLCVCAGRQDHRAWV